MKSGIWGGRISATTPPALTLHTAAITLWNTVYIERTIEPLTKRESLLMNCWSSSFSTAVQNIVLAWDINEMVTPPSRYYAEDRLSFGELSWKTLRLLVSIWVKLFPYSLPGSSWEGRLP
jgi:hypothetical protein